MEVELRQQLLLKTLKAKSKKKRRRARTVNSACCQTPDAATEAVWLEDKHNLRLSLLLNTARLHFTPHWLQLQST